MKTYVTDFKLKLERKECSSVIELKDGRLASAADTAIQIWNLKTQENENTFKTCGLDYYSLVELADGRIASRGFAYIIIWNFAKVTDCIEGQYSNVTNTYLFSKCDPNFTLNNNTCIKNNYNYQANINDQCEKKVINNCKSKSYNEFLKDCVWNECASGYTLSRDSSVCVSENNISGDINNSLVQPETVTLNSTKFASVPNSQTAIYNIGSYSLKLILLLLFINIYQYF